MTVVFTEQQVEAPAEVLTEREQRARTLEAAALEIEVRGWRRARLTDENGHVCMAGAIGAALGNDPADAANYCHAHKIWFGRDEVEDFDLLHIPRINDTSVRVEQVTYALRNRAAEIREGK